MPVFKGSFDKRVTHSAIGRANNGFKKGNSLFKTFRHNFARHKAK